MKRALSLLTDVLYPRKCPYCGDVIPTGQTYCGCDITDITVSETQNRKGIESREHHLQYVFKAVSPIIYKAAGQSAVLKLKYGARTGTGVYLARQMSDCVAEYLPIDEIDFITPVPARREDLKDKLIDPTAFLSRQVGKMLKKNSLDSLQKIYQTDKQHTLDKFRRAANVLGAYEVIDKSLILDKTVLLVDDILTTGYTADECAKMLRVRGCRRVYLCTAAFAQKDGKKEKEKEKQKHGKQ